jgi:TatD DNase family protein
MTAMLVDSHCHIPLITEGKPPEAVGAILAGAAEQGVEHMLCVSVDIESFPKVLGMARRYDNVSASFGIHPNTVLSEEPGIDTLLAYAHDESVVAIGETGLDYYRSSGDLEWQKERFRRHIACARACGKPLIIHSREAKADVLAILEDEKANEVGGIMHCFVDDYDTAVKAISLGFVISFSGIVTFKNAAPLQDVARRLPLESILVETDSPYLAPVPYRGKENQPAYVRKVAEFLAELKGVDYETVARRTTANFYRVFPKLQPAGASA